MKNKILGLALITIASFLIYVFIAYAPFIKNLNASDFFKGFAIGIGVITGSGVLVLLIKRAGEEAMTNN